MGIFSNFSSKKFPGYNADIARFLTVFFMTFSVILLTSSEAPINRMVQEYYGVPEAFTERAMIQLATTMLTFGTISGLSWAFHIMLRNTSWKWVRVVVHTVNVFMHYLALLVFLMTLWIIFVDMIGKIDQNQCEHPNLPNCTQN